MLTIHFCHLQVSKKYWYSLTAIKIGSLGIILILATPGQHCPAVNKILVRSGCPIILIVPIVSVLL